jgi:hypothetical protein
MYTSQLFFLVDFFFFTSKLLGIVFHFLFILLFILLFDFYFTITYLTFKEETNNNNLSWWFFCLTLRWTVLEHGWKENALLLYFSLDWAGKLVWGLLRYMRSVSSRFHIIFVYVLLGYNSTSNVEWVVVLRSVREGLKFSYWVMIFPVVPHVHILSRVLRGSTMLLFDCFIPDYFYKARSAHDRLMFSTCVPILR